MKILKDDEQVIIETPLTKLRKDLSESIIDFSFISTLKGEKTILVQSFREVKNELTK